jgi:PIN domain nuclease of toxin-antitoxin system
LTVLDASALLGFLKGGPCAAEVEEMLRAGQAAISAVNIAEVLDVLVRRDGRSSTDVLEHLRPLFGDSLRVVSPDADLAVHAGEIRARYYDRRTSAISLADGFAVASAAAADESLASSDAVLVAVATDSGVEVQPLPNSSGVRPKLA